MEKLKPYVWANMKLTSPKIFIACQLPVNRTLTLETTDPDDINKRLNIHYKVTPLTGSSGFFEENKDINSYPRYLSGTHEKITIKIFDSTLTTLLGSATINTTAKFE